MGFKPSEDCEDDPFASDGDISNSEPSEELLHDPDGNISNSGSDTPDSEDIASSDDTDSSITAPEVEAWDSDCLSD